MLCSPFELIVKRHFFQFSWEKSFSENPATQVLSGRGVHLFQDGGFKITFPENLDFGKSVSNDFQTDILQPTVFFRRDLVEKIGGIKKGTITAQNTQ